MTRIDYMSVLKNLRGLSEMQFYKTAIGIRKELTVWLLRDFGAKRNVKSVNQVVKNISPEDQKIVDDIFAKYGKTSNHTYKSEYPEWFVDFERRIISENLAELVTNITEANSIYPNYMFEWDLRRGFQDKAVANCYRLYQELQYIVSLFPTDLNRFVELLDDVEKEVQLLKGWRQSDNKKRKEAEKTA